MTARLQKASYSIECLFELKFFVRAYQRTLNDSVENGIKFLSLGFD